MTTAHEPIVRRAGAQGASNISYLLSPISYLLSAAKAASIFHLLLISYLLSPISYLLSAASAATVRLAAPDAGALYDLHSPCVKEFLEHFEERGVKPPRPPLSEQEIAQSNRQHIAYLKWREAGSPMDKRVKDWEDRFNFYMDNAWSKELMKRAYEEEKTYPQPLP